MNAKDLLYDRGLLCGQIPKITTITLNLILDSTELRPKVEQPQDSGATTDSWFAQTGKRAS